MIVKFLLLSVFIRFNCAQLPWSWTQVPLWADFGTNNVSLLSDYQAKFVGQHYKIISLEKCLGNPSRSNRPTEEAFYQAASHIRQYTPSLNDTQILFYFHIEMCLCSCYNITSTVCNNSSMWLKNKTGYPIYNSNNKNQPMYDMTQEIVQDWWANAVVSVMQAAHSQGIIVNGVFADGTCAALRNKVTSEVAEEYINGIYATLDKTRALFAQLSKELDNNFMVLGNGLSSYSIQPDHCLPSVAHLDGVLIEHFGAFEEVISNANSDGMINATDIAMWTKLVRDIIVNEKYGTNKSVFIKSWIGPETGPIDSYGPNWLDGYKYSPRPTNHAAIANYSALLIDYPLASYLCGLMYENVYFNYAFWYDINQGYVPCPNNVNSCDCPANWYQEFENILGKAINDPVIDYSTYQCTRSFENANVSINWLNDSSGVIEWFNQGDQM